MRTAPQSPSSAYSTLSMRLPDASSRSMSFRELLSTPTQLPITFATPGYFTVKVGRWAATTRYPLGGIIVLGGKVNSTPLLNRHPETLTLVVEVLCSSMYSSRTFSEAGWYLISLITTCAGAVSAPASSATNDTTLKLHFAIVFRDFGNALTDQTPNSYGQNYGTSLARYRRSP